ncbi:hypothetical protein HDU97_006357 [Phlyctochytrium planicorne]|nr:hypothetical protein HDU97_006357 [Phlyctochytrium planicorne]
MKSRSLVIILAVLVFLTFQFVFADPRERHSHQHESTPTPRNLHRTTNGQRLKEEAQKVQHRVKGAAQKVQNRVKGAAQKIEHRVKEAIKHVPNPFHKKTKGRPQQQQPQPASQPQPQQIDPNLNEDEQIYLSEHNEVRREFGKNPLIYDKNLGRSAEEYAKFLAFRNECKLKHDRAGQNLANFPAVKGMVKYLCDKDEREDFFQNHVYNHFSQVIWGNTQRVGCGKAVAGCGTIFACHYDPVGNFIGQQP